MTKTIKLPPLVIDEPTSKIIQRVADGSNVSSLLRDWIRTGLQAHPRFAAANTDNVPTGELCMINKHGRPRKKLVPDGATPAEVEGIVEKVTIADGGAVTATMVYPSA